MSATPKPIEWTRGRYSSIRGEVGGTELFIVSMLTDRSGRYALDTHLPLSSTYRYDTEQEAKEAAKRMLAAFVDRLTA